MNKEDIKAKMAELNEKMKKIGEKVKDGADTAYIMGLEAKDKIDDTIKEANSGVNALRESYKIFSEKAKGKASSELIKAQMNIDVARKELEAMKEEHDKDKLEKYIEDTTEYMEGCIILAELSLKEAELARMELVKSQDEYDKKYGNE